MVKMGIFQDIIETFTGGGGGGGDTFLDEIIANVEQSLVFTLPGLLGFIPDIAGGADLTNPLGIGGDIPSNTSGNLRNNTNLVITSDRGFVSTTTNPQSVIPIIIGTYSVTGFVRDYFLLGRDDERMFAVIAIAQAPISKNVVFIDNQDISTLPQFIDVDAGGTPDDNKPWLKFIGNGGESGDFILANSGKKNFNIGAISGEVATTPQVYFFNVVSGKNEVRIFLSVNVPDIVTDTLETADADYTGLTGKTLIIEYIISGITTTTDTVTFTDILLSSGADYTALNGKTLIVRVDGSDRTATFTGAAVDAATTADEINTQLATWVDSIAFGNEIKIHNETGTAGATLTINGGTAAAQLNFGDSNDEEGCRNNIDNQVSGVTPTIINVDELRLESENADNKRLTLTGTGRDQLNFGSDKNFGATISYSLDMQEKGSSSTTPITSDTDVEMEKIINGLPQRATLIVEKSGNFYIDAAVPNFGWWKFNLSVTKATNNAKVNMAIIEVMSDFILTDSGDFSGIAGQTLILEINGTQQTVTFGVGTNTAPLAIIDINDQLGTLVTASASGNEILIRAIANPVGTETIPERKELKLIGGTASDAMNFKPLYSETKSYNLPDTGYAIANVRKTGSISGAPKFSFNVTGDSPNPAAYLKKISVNPLNKFHPGLGFFNDINEEDFDDSIDFDTDEELEANIALLDIGYGQTEKILMQAGSLILSKPGGRYSLIPETDSDPVAELFQTDDDRIDNIRKGSLRWGVIEQTSKFNVLRATFPDATKKFVTRDLVIDAVGEVDVENGKEPRIFENGELINISDSGKDFYRAKTISFPAVTGRAQVLRLAKQAFRKSNLVNIALTFDVSIIHYYLKNGDIVKIHSDNLGYIGKLFRIMKIDENLNDENFGFALTCHEHFPEIYA